MINYPSKGSGQKFRLHGSEGFNNSKILCCLNFVFLFIYIQDFLLVRNCMNIKKQNKTQLTKGGNSLMERAYSWGSEGRPKLKSLDMSNLCNFRGIIQSLRLWLFFYKII